MAYKKKKKHVLQNSWRASRNDPLLWSQKVLRRECRFRSNFLLAAYITSKIVRAHTWRLCARRGSACGVRYEHVLVKPTEPHWSRKKVAPGRGRQDFALSLTAVQAHAQDSMTEALYPCNYTLDTCVLQVRSGFLQWEPASTGTHFITRSTTLNTQLFERHARTQICWTCSKENLFTL